MLLSTVSSSRHCLALVFRRSVPIVFSLLALSACSGRSPALAPASPESHEIAELFWQLFVLAAIIFVVVEGLLIVAIIKFRAKPGAVLPKQIHGNFHLEFMWTLIPTILVVIIFVRTVEAMSDLTSEHANALHVKVTAVQWWWQVEYPDERITTANEIHVPVGRPVDVELASGDVNHSFWVPQLAGKTDAIPGHTNWVRFTPQAAGTYRGQCAEYCGLEHADMAFLVVADQPVDFDAWVATERQPAVLPAGQPPEGAVLFQQRGCVGCHTIQGTQANGKIGPDLTHFGSRQGIAGETLANTPENLVKWLADPQAVKAGTKMPNLHLSADDMNKLSSYLLTLK